MPEGTLKLPSIIDKQEIRDDYQAAINLLNNAIADWENMTATQKQTWVANNMDAVLRIERAILRLMHFMVNSDN